MGNVVVRWLSWAVFGAPPPAPPALPIEMIQTIETSEAAAVISEDQFATLTLDARDKDQLRCESEGCKCEGTVGVWLLATEREARCRVKFLQGEAHTPAVLVMNIQDRAAWTFDDHLCCLRTTADDGSFQVALRYYPSNNYAQPD